MIPGDFIDQILEAQGGSEPYTWDSSNLPSSLKIRKWGSISGALSVSVVNTYTAILELRDHAGTMAVKKIPIHVENINDKLINYGFTSQDGIFLEPQSLGNSVFCVVPGGDFLIGYHPSQVRNNYLRLLHNRHNLPINQDIARTNWPAGWVHTDTFLIQRCEVTNLEYYEFVKDTGHPVPPDWNHGQPRQGTNAMPVVDIAREDAMAYCQYKTEKAQQIGLDIVYRLPSNWQWEKAAKGSYGEGSQEPSELNGAARLYPWGDCWVDGNSNDKVCGVGHIVNTTDYTSGANSLRVCDLVGNVSEWIDGGQYLEEYDAYFMHIRGGSFKDSGPLWGLTFFHYGIPKYVPFENEIGFRCVIELNASKRLAQALVPLGNDSFTDIDGRERLIGKFHMARFSVTNEEYARFDPSHSYEDTEKWYPVTNINQLKAQDFCKWKSQQDGRNYRLPSFEHWLRAYRGPGDREYPWGNEYSRYLCNSNESGWGRPVNVHALWQGTTPEGIYNLCGNTFEWLYEGYSVGGSFKRNCRQYGAPPYTRLDTNRHAIGDIGFRYIAV